MRKVANACDVAMPREGKGKPHTPVYWWNDKIVQIRAECHKTRRLSQRTKGKPTFPELEEKFKLSRSKLINAIKHNKRQCWTALLEVVDEDPWGKPYKVVMTRLKSQSRRQPTCPEQLEKIVSTLFPKQEPFVYQVEQRDEDIPPISREDLLPADNGEQQDIGDVSGYIQYLPCRGNFPRAMEVAKTDALA